MCQFLEMKCVLHSSEESTQKSEFAISRCTPDWLICIRMYIFVFVKGGVKRQKSLKCRNHCSSEPLSALGCTLIPALIPALYRLIAEIV